MCAYGEFIVEIRNVKRAAGKLTIYVIFFMPVIACVVAVNHLPSVSCFCAGK
jgi:hypothetical protein